MNQNQIVFVLDLGNTFLKVGVFYDGILEKVERISYEQLEKLKDILKLNEFTTPVFVSSVVSEELTKKVCAIFTNVILFHRDLKLPITIGYKSFQTLGLDRICNAVSTFMTAKGKNSVSIDIGTCIKFDFIDESGTYCGGSISPGIDLRYKSMNDYTANLPLIKDKENTKLVGNSTINSMKSGVMNGIQAELNQFMKLYDEDYQDLMFFVTGGDAVYFDFPFKNNTFVDENLTLKGLYEIYKFNAE